MIDNVLTLLFFSDTAAEEVKLTFSKAKVIHLFSFTTGNDDFNFFIVTNLSIDLYKVDVDQQRAKIVKNIPLDLNVGVEPYVLMEPLTSTVVAIDPKTNSCWPYFLNMQRQGNSAVKGQMFKLDNPQPAPTSSVAGD
jgi:hypothetical protein